MTIIDDCVGINSSTYEEIPDMSFFIWIQKVTTPFSSMALCFKYSEDYLFNFVSKTFVKYNGLRRLCGDMAWIKIKDVFIDITPRNIPAKPVYLPNAVIREKYRNPNFDEGMSWVGLQSGDWFKFVKKRADRSDGICLYVGNNHFIDFTTNQLLDDPGAETVMTYDVNIKYNFFECVKPVHVEKPIGMSKYKEEEN